MPTDLDVFRTTAVLIREHVDGATLEAAHRADSFLEQGNMDVVRVWRAVLKAVEELQRTEPGQAEIQH